MRASALLALRSAVLLANILGEWASVNLSDPSMFRPVELVQSAAAGEHNKSPSTEQNETDERNPTASAACGGKPSAKSTSSTQAPAAQELEHTTQDLISQILSKSAARDPLKRSHLQAGAMHKLKIHELSELSPSPRGSSGRK